MTFESKDAISLSALLLSIASLYFSARNYRSQRQLKMAEMRRDISLAHQECRLASVQLRQVMGEIVNSTEPARFEALLMKAVAASEAAETFIRSGDALHQAIKDAPDDVVPVYYAKHLAEVEAATRQMTTYAEGFAVHMKEGLTNQ